MVDSNNKPESNLSQVKFELEAEIFPHIRALPIWNQRTLYAMKSQTRHAGQRPNPVLLVPLNLVKGD